jgi:hypothetical protein
MRQFDVFVFSESFDESDEQHQNKIQPPFTDAELGWFFTNDWNKHLNEIEGEWVVFAHPSIQIDRNFLNNVADVTDSFPMVDAFAPRIRPPRSNTNKRKFFSGRILKRPLKGSGFVEIDEDAPMRYVASPHPYLAIFSRRIIQRTGGFDTTLPPNARLADYTLRMMHAGGKMFSVPYLVAQVGNSTANSNEQNSLQEAARDSRLATARELQLGTARDSQPEIAREPSPGTAATKALACDASPDLKSTAIILSKAFGFEASLPFALRHPSVIPTLLRGRKDRKEKRKAATLLSKLTAKFLAEVTE